MSGEHVAAQAAIEKRRRLQREEEEMTRYTRDELDNDWEFKIVRSATGAFGKPQVMAQVVEEEALAGWGLVEKFDDNRLRFKRPASARRRDAELPPFVNPYRTTYGLSDAGLALLIFGILVGVGALVFLLVQLLS